MMSDEQRQLRSRIHPEIAEQVRLSEAASPADPDRLTPAQVRAAFEAARKPLRRAPNKLEIRDLVVQTRDGPLDARLYRPQHGRPGDMPGVAYFHGGGFTNGDLDSHDAVCCAMAEDVGCVLVSVDYRKLPQHPFPAAFDDAVDTLLWLHAHAAELGADPRRLAAAGDSAGANIAVGAALQLRQVLPLQGLWLAYPFLGLDFDAPSYRENAAAPLLSPQRCQRIMRDYFTGDLALADWRVAPLLADDFQGLPAAIVLAAELDPIRSDAERFVQRLVPEAPGTRLIAAGGMPHGFIKWGSISPAIRELARESHLALRELLV